MQISEEKVNDVTVVSLKGRLDASTSGALESVLNGLAAQKDAKVLVDAAALEYISSAGLRVLLAAAKQFKKVQGRIALCALSANVKQVFEISGFTSIFAIYPGRAEGVTALR